MWKASSSTSSLTSRRREQAPRMQCPSASSGGRPPRCAPKRATTTPAPFARQCARGVPLWPSMTALGAAHVLFPPCKPGPAHPICTLSVPPLISLPVCKNSSHSPSPFPCLSRRHRGGIGATCPPPANISRLGRILSHGDPKRAPGAEFCAILHDALACVHACRACCSCLVQKSGPMCAPASPREPLWVHVVVAHL